MLVRFSTRHGQLVMLGEPAVALLRLGGHSGTVPGAVLAGELPPFLDKLRRGLELHGDELSPAPPPPDPERRDDDEPRERPVSLRHRAVPLLLAPALALLLLAAHFLHAGSEAVAAVVLLLVGLLFVRRPWAARALQVVLAAGTIEWLLTATSLARMRAQHDQPFLRLLVILGSVALFTAVAAALFQHRALRARFGLGRRTPVAEQSTN